MAEHEVRPEDLPDAELEVLACLWKLEAATARQVREEMQDYRQMTHSAVSTLLKRLEDKGMVAREKGPVGKAFVFRPVVNRRRTYRRILKALRDRIFAGNGLQLVSSLFETRAPTAEELDQLQTLVDDLRRKQKPKRSES